MNMILGAIQNTISISLFNRGQAGKIFSEVKQSGAKVVMKNNVAECVLLSPDEYVHLMDEVNDARLLSQATARMAHYDPKKNVSQEQVNALLGITPEAISGADEVEIE